MRRFYYPLFVLVLLAGMAHAGVVGSGTAQTVAVNYFKHSTSKQVNTVTLAFKEVAPTGEPVYYVYNVNGNEGFIIVSAEDAGSPIIGYSTEGGFIVPSATHNAELSYWMNLRKEEIISMRKLNQTADASATKQWTECITNKFSPSANSTAIGPLVKTTWDQSGGGNPAYNALCPGGSLTGCVATAMSMIMKYWDYPTTGTGSSSYNISPYGTLSANYAAATYNWKNMPLTSSNASVALINYHCGVSVNMNYSPSASGAYVCGGKPSAEYSYKTYFKYDPTISCVSQASYSTAAWVALMEAEFVAGRPVQYQGVEAASSSGHTWICDGNDINDLLHMNWGWGGASNGYFAVTSLTAGGITFDTQLKALIKIKPLAPANALDAGTYGITAPAGTTCNPIFTPTVTVKNFGSDTLTSCTINYKVDANPNQTYSWTGSLAAYQSVAVALPTMTVSVGSHVFSASTSMPNSSTDADASNDQSQSILNVLSNTASVVSPYSEGFETTGFPYADCYVYTTMGPQWGTTATAAKTGTGSLMLTVFNELNGDGDEFITPSIDMTAVTGSTMTFQLAHAQKSTNDADQLQILSSTNCGAAWVQRYAKSSTALSTAGVLATVFTPSASQWRQEIVPISSLAGSSDVRFKFKFSSAGAGNNIYLDDININTVGNGVSEEFMNGFNLEIYPNPMVDQTNISFTLNGKYKVAIGVYDIVGKEIIPLSNASELNAGSYTLPLNKGSLNSGVYFVKLEVNGYSVTKKIVVQ